MRRALTVPLALTLAACSHLETETPEPSASPNIIVILADDLGYGDVGVYGSDVIETPHIDRLARDGVRLTNGYVAAAVCSPSRAGFYAGLNPSRFGYDYNPTANYKRGPDAELGLPTDVTTIADVLREAGYATGLIGKWHLGVLEPYHPLRRGFDEFFGFLGGGTSYIDGRLPGVESWPETEPAWPPPTVRSDEVALAIMNGHERVEVNAYLTDVFADRAVDFVTRHKDERFFLMLAPNAPHTPIQATSEYVDRYRHIERDGPRIYAAMVAALDDYVGDVVSALAAHGLEENTLIVFFSDNGCVTYMGEPVCSNAPLAGGKRYHLEGGIRIPFIWKWPAGLPSGTTYEHPVSSIDLFATFAAAGGSRAQTTDSVNLLPYLRGERSDPPHELLFWRAAPNVAVRKGSWKMWRVNNSDIDPDEMFFRTLPEVDYPPVSPLGQTTVLYDLSRDVSEQRDLSSEHPEIVEQLEASIAAWEAELAPPLWISRRSTLHDLHGKLVQLLF